MQRNVILQGDVLVRLKELPRESVHCIVTSPPYWGLRDYGVEGQLGLEETPEEYIHKVTAIFEEVRAVLKKDGTLWLNMGDCYSGSGLSGGTARVPETLSHRGKQASGRIPVFKTRSGTDCDPKRGVAAHGQPKKFCQGLKAKDLVGQPWRVAFALQAAGWYLRSDIIWHKPNPMPESVTDRPTKAHEYLFLLSKSQKYFYDAEAITQPCSLATHAHIAQNLEEQIGSERAHAGGKTNGRMKAVVHPKARAAINEKSDKDAARAELGMKDSTLFRRGKNWRNKQNESFTQAVCLRVAERNARTVWEIPVQGYKGAHFATFPEKLVEPCIKAGCPAGGIVLDPFMGSGTTALVAAKLGRDWLGIELNEKYIALARKRLGLFGLMSSETENEPTEPIHA